MKTHPFLRGLALLAFFTVNLWADESQVPRWQPHDFTFTSASPPQNPFIVAFSAEATGPDGTKLTVPGFYDGQNTWKIRFAPTSEGKWSLTTHSDVADLDNQQAGLSCTPNNNPLVHGGLKVDAQHPRHFIYEDGTRWFPLGYECDWFWALDTGNATLPTVDPLLDKISASGFTFVLLNAYAYDTAWRKGHTGEDDYGPPPLCAWEGTNENPDYSHFSLAYWQHFDQIIETLNRRGLGAHIYLRVYNKMVKWPKNGSPEDDLYFRWIIARYAAYPNVVWDLAKEANNEKSLPYKIDRLKFIRATDPYHHLLTVHTDISTYDHGSYQGLVDFRTDQFQSTKESAIHDRIIHQIAQGSWPVINAELAYEQGPLGPNDKTYNSAQSPEEQTRRAWEAMMGGGYAAYYYTYTAWDVIRPGDTPPGYAYFKNLHDFFAGTEYWLLDPADSLVSNGYCLANPGKEYVTFQNNAAPFTLKLEGLAFPLQAEWFQPYTGQKVDAGPLQNGNVSLTPPAKFGNGPVALHVGNTHSSPH
jgi:hypothetical protein